MVGTVGYLAPELLMGEGPIDSRPDQYSLAVSLYQVLSGKLPFDAPTDAAVLVKQAEGKVPSLRQFAPGVPPEAAAAVRRALGKRPADRFPDCGAFARAVLGSTAVTAPAPPAAPRRPSRPSPTPPPAPRPKPVEGARGGRGRLVAGALVLGAALVLGGVFGVLWYRSRSNRSPVVQAAATTFRFKPSPEIAVRAGSSAPVPVAIVRVGYEGAVRLGCPSPVPGARLTEGAIGPGQNETAVRVEVAEGAAGRLEVPLQGVGGGREETLVLRLLVLPPPQLKVVLPPSVPPLTPGGPVLLRVQVIREGADDQTTRFTVDTTQLPAWVLVIPTRGNVEPAQDGFDLRVQASRRAERGKAVRLPITVLLGRPPQQMKRQVEAELRVAPRPGAQGRKGG